MWCEFLKCVIWGPLGPVNVPKSSSNCATGVAPGSEGESPGDINLK